MVLRLNGDTDMFELCAFLAAKTPKASKPRKPPGPKINVGVAVTVMGRHGVIIGKNDKNTAWWDVDFGGKVYGFARTEITICA